ncbi:MAG TPA: Sec-independent protein translocase protein TatB [Sphingomonadaceae bacterium]
MFDIGWDEMLFTAVVAVVVVGPKDLPMALRTVGRWMGKARRVSNHFRAGIEAMIREAELAEMEKEWQEQNRKVMAENPGQAMTAENAAGGGEPTGEPAPAPAPSPIAEQPAAPEGAVSQPAGGGPPPPP